VTSAPETKAGRRGFDRNQPRDRTGKWVETGAELRNSITRTRGTVLRANAGTGTREGTFTVRLADGSEVNWEKSSVDVVRNPDGSKPTADKPTQVPATPRAPAADDARLAGAVDQVYGAESSPANPSAIAGAVTEVYAADAAPRAAAALPYNDRLPRVGDVVLLADGREVEVRHIYADGRTVRISHVGPGGAISRERVEKSTVTKITSPAPDKAGRAAAALDGIQHLPEDVRQELTDAVQEMTALYDVPFGGVTAREEDWHGGDSTAIGGTRIAFNPKIADPAWRAERLGSGYSIGRTVREAFIHEFGHTIDHQYKIDAGKRGRLPLHQKFQSIFDNNEVASGKDNPNYDPNDPDSTVWLYPEGTNGDLAERVSTYASAGQTGEAVAESFLAGHLGRTNQYTLAVRTAFAPYVRQDGDTTVLAPDGVDAEVVEKVGPRPVPGPAPRTMTPTAILAEMRALRAATSEGGTAATNERARGPILSRYNLLADELVRRSGYRPPIQPQPAPRDDDD